MIFSLRRRMIKSEARRIFFSAFRISLCVSGLIMLLLIGVSAFFRFLDPLLYGTLSKNGFYAVSALARLAMAFFISPFFSSCAVFFRNLSYREGSYAFCLFGHYSSLSSVRRSFCEVFVISLAILFSLYLPMILFNVVGFLVVYTKHILLAFVFRCVALLLSVLFIVFAAGFAPIFRCSCDFTGAKSSFAYMKGHKLEFVCFAFSFIPLFLLSYLCLGIPLIFAIPYFMISISCYLNYVISEKSAPIREIFHEI